MAGLIEAGLIENADDIERFFGCVYFAGGTELGPLPSMRANIRAGKLPEAEANGVRYLKTPVTIQDQPLRR